MVTKKQKRAAAQAKREAFMADLKADGLKAQKLDQEAQARDKEEIRREAWEMNNRYNRILEDAFALRSAFMDERN